MTFPRESLIIETKSELKLLSGDSINFGFRTLSLALQKFKTFINATAVFLMLSEKFSRPWILILFRA